MRRSIVCALTSERFVGARRLFTVRSHFAASQVATNAVYAPAEKDRRIEDKRAVASDHTVRAR